MWRRAAVVASEGFSARSAASTVEALDLQSTRIASTLASRTMGRDPQAGDLNLGLMAQDVYKTTGSAFKDWKPLGEDHLKRFGVDFKSFSTPSGFVARAYEHKDEGCVVSFKGTSSGRDWLTNFRQGLGLETSQHNETVALAKEMRKTYGDDLVFTGHSKGGGQAALAAAVTGNPAITFNAAGIHPNTFRELGLEPDKVAKQLAEGQVRSYVVSGEMLSRVQGGMAPGALGHQISLADPHPQQGWTSHIPGSGLKHSVELHFMSNTLDALKPYLDANAKPVLTAADALGHQLRDQPLFQQAMQAFKTAGPQNFRFGSEQEMQNAAGVAAINAEAKGLNRIDAIVPSVGGRDFFLVQGSPSDPAHQRVLVDGNAARQPLQQSAVQLEQSRQQQGPQTPLPDPAQQQAVQGGDGRHR